MNNRMSPMLHAIAALAVTGGVFWLAGLFAPGVITLRTVPLIIVTAMGASWCVGELISSHARRRSPQRADPPAVDDDTIDIRGMDDAQVQAIIMARSIRTGRTTHGIVDRAAGVLHLHDAGPGIVLPDDGSAKKKLN